MQRVRQFLHDTGSCFLVACVVDLSVKIKKAMPDAFPDLRSLYGGNDGNTIEF